MLIEILVLSRDESFGDAVGNGAEGHIDAPLARKLGNQIAIIGMNAGHYRRLIFGQHFVVRQILRCLPQDKCRRRSHRHEDDQARREHEAEEAHQEAATAATPLLLRRLDRGRNIHFFCPVGSVLKVRSANTMATARFTKQASCRFLLDGKACPARSAADKLKKVEAEECSTSYSRENRAIEPNP